MKTRKHKKQTNSQSTESSLINKEIQIKLDSGLHDEDEDYGIVDTSYRGR